MKYRLTKVDSHSAAVAWAGSLVLLVLVLMLPFLTIGMILSGESIGAIIGAFIGVLIIVPLLYFLIGYVSTRIMLIALNFVLSKTGGVSMDIEKASNKK